MIDITTIDLLYHSNRLGFERRLEPSEEPVRNTPPAVFPLHQAIQTLYSDRLKHRFTDVLHSDISQSSRVPRYEALYKQYLGLLQTHLLSAGETDILEVECGSGKFCQTLFEHGYRAFGVEQSHSLLHQARRNSPGCEFERASAYVSFQNLFVRQFDAVVYLDAIEHLHSPQLFVERAVESLVPGGLLIVTARYRGYLLDLTKVLAGPTSAQPALREQPASASGGVFTTLGRLLKQFGLEIVEFQKAGRLPQPWRSQLFVARKPA